MTEIIEQFSRYIITGLGVLIILICIVSLLRRRAFLKDNATLTNVSTGERIILKTFETSIGRSKACDVILNHGTVSRFHAVIALGKKSWTVTDTFSKTGTFINMKRIKRKAVIQNGDTVSFGTASYKFETLYGDGGAVNENNAVKNPKNASVPVYVSALINDAQDAVYRLDVSECIIGRNPQLCEITLSQPTVSGKHARLYHTSRGWNIEDLNSKAGVKVNGKYISQKTKLNDGDIINLGGVKLMFCLRYEKVNK